mmetsp:Transcript_14274/g.31485  ORF Transcript_14274/g.31485 Transcript_14274/m.31485 type:complete len:267 (-) Transcript_14274:802-1602(-)
MDSMGDSWGACTPDALLADQPPDCTAAAHCLFSSCTLLRLFPPLPLSLLYKWLLSLRALMQLLLSVSLCRQLRTSAEIFCMSGSRLAVASCDFMFFSMNPVAASTTAASTACRTNSADLSPPLPPAIREVAQETRSALAHIRMSPSSHRACKTTPASASSSACAPVPQSACASASASNGPSVPPITPPVTRTALALRKLSPDAASSANSSCREEQRPPARINCDKRFPQVPHWAAICACRSACSCASTCASVCVCTRAFCVPRCPE